MDAALWHARSEYLQQEGVQNNLCCCERECRRWFAGDTCVQYSMHWQRYVTVRHLLFSAICSGTDQINLHSQSFVAQLSCPSLSSPHDTDTAPIPWIWPIPRIRAQGNLWIRFRWGASANCSSQSKISLIGFLVRKSTILSLSEVNRHKLHFFSCHKLLRVP